MVELESIELKVVYQMVIDQKGDTMEAANLSLVNM